MIGTIIVGVLLFIFGFGGIVAILCNSEGEEFGTNFLLLIAALFTLMGLSAVIESKIDYSGQQAYFMNIAQGWEVERILVQRSEAEVGQTYWSPQENTYLVSKEENGQKTYGIMADLGDGEGIAVVLIDSLKVSVNALPVEVEEKENN